VAEVLKRFILTAFILLVYCSNSSAQRENSAPLFKYETVKITPGEFNLFIPILSSFSIEHIKKRAQIKKSFFIGKFEVSNDQWNECYNRGGCSNPAKIEEGEAGNHPVVRVNWHAAYQFSKWLSKVSAKTYRLPTEEEWVYAVYQGKDHKETVQEYDYSDLSEIKLLDKRTQPQGTFAGNAWGLADLEGNVWEWTLTCWYASEENILKDSAAQELNTPSACFTRIALGENRTHVPDFIWDTYNGGCSTLKPAANLGFRLVMESDEK
jgi:formylglycine-generating enzyme required for sulfatase activity